MNGPVITGGNQNGLEWEDQSQEGWHPRCTVVCLHDATREPHT